MESTRAKALEKLIEAMTNHLIRHGCRTPFPFSADEAEICQDALTEVCRKFNLNAEFSAIKRPVVCFYPRSR